jgi:hypothetical protein
MHPPTFSGVTRYDGITWVSLGGGDGLRPGVPKAITQDAAGGMWFGGDNGLIRDDRWLPPTHPRQSRSGIVGHPRADAHVFTFLVFMSLSRHMTVTLIDKYLKEKEQLDSKYREQLLAELDQLTEQSNRIREALGMSLPKLKAEKKSSTGRAFRMSPVRQKAFDAIAKGKDSEEAVLKELKKTEKTPGRFLLRAINDLRKMGKVKESDGKLSVA